MRYANTSERGLDFDLRGKRYVVPVGGTCDIPAGLEYAITRRGLPLERDPSEVVEEDMPELPPEWRGDELPPAGSVARTWAVRAVEASAAAEAERRRADELHDRAAAAEALADQLQADVLAARGERDEAMALLEEAGAKLAPDAPGVSGEGAKPPTDAATSEGGGRRSRTR